MTDLAGRVAEGLNDECGVFDLYVEGESWRVAKFIRSVLAREETVGLACVICGEMEARAWAGPKCDRPEGHDFSRRLIVVEEGDDR